MHAELREFHRVECDLIVGLSRATLVTALNLTDAHHGTACAPVLVQAALAVEKMAGVELPTVTCGCLAVGDEL